MTINELLALAGLTASDEIPVWDAEGQVNGRTKKITAQNLAASIKTIASLIASSDLDTTPTSGSAKAVQSGGVYDAIQQSTAKIKSSASTLSHLESVIVTLGSSLADHDSLTGNVRANFTDATLGFNGAICECTIQRNANGVYLATFITTASDVITDYYYSSTHHWSSSKQSTAITQLAPTYDATKIKSAIVYRSGHMVFGKIDILPNVLSQGYNGISLAIPNANIVVEQYVTFFTQGSADDNKFFWGSITNNLLMLRCSTPNSLDLHLTFCALVT